MRVGLTGGIGSGKSTVSALLEEHGAVIVDYDLLAREVVEPGEPALDAIAERFGDEVLTPAGELNRPALGAVVFADDAARKDLEAITHPAIRQRAESVERQAGPDAVVVHDNPLLIEMGAAAHCDAVLVVDVPSEVQIARLVGARGMEEADARARIAAQASREERLTHADHVIDNSGSLDQLRDAVDAIWREITRT
nr:dephospho-CoA kinase [Aeromicrobium sp. PE09-221]